jgi:putative phosphoribosyl transferase
MFEDRSDAGRRLLEVLPPLPSTGTVVLAIPRGGVPVGAEIARGLGIPLDVVLVRKVGAPENPEFAIGALAEGIPPVLSARAVCELGLSPKGTRELVARAEEQLRERVRAFRGARAPVDLGGRTALVVDDGLATGRSALAAVRSARARGAVHVIMAAPVASPQAVEDLLAEADEVVCVRVPSHLRSVGGWYADFAPPPDSCLAAALGLPPESIGTPGERRP